MTRRVSKIVPGLADKVREEKKDGKKIRSTENTVAYDEPLHIVSAHIGELRMTLAQEAVAGKPDETPAVQRLMKSLEIKGHMVVSDGSAEFEHGQKILIEHHERLQTGFLLKGSHDDPDVQVPDGSESNSYRFRQKLISVVGEVQRRVVSRKNLTKNIS